MRTTLKNGKHTFIPARSIRNVRCIRKPIHKGEYIAVNIYDTKEGGAPQLKYYSSIQKVKQGQFKPFSIKWARIDAVSGNTSNTYNYGNIKQITVQNTLFIMAQGGDVEIEYDKLDIE